MLFVRKSQTFMQFFMSIFALGATTKAAAFENSPVPNNSNETNQSSISFTKTILEILGIQDVDPNTVIDEAISNQSLLKTEINPNVTVQSSFGGGVPPARNIQ